MNRSPNIFFPYLYDYQTRKQESVPTHGVYNTDLIHDVNPSPFTVRRGPVAVVHLADIRKIDLADLWLREYAQLARPSSASRYKGIRGEAAQQVCNV